MGGKIENIIGDSFAGKTLLLLSLFAEVAHNPEFDEYELYHDDVENGCEFDITSLFGKKTASRLRSPAVDKEGEPVCSETIQDFQRNITKLLDKGKPFVYGLDSLDALTSNEEQKKVDAFINLKEGEAGKGSYGMDKVKMLTQVLRMIKGKLKKTNSLLIVISQTRDNIDPMSFTKKVRSGGRALKFYSAHEIWLAGGDKIKGKDGKTTIGYNCLGKTTKNKSTGKLREFRFPVYYQYGIDDIGSCIDFLVEKKVWQHDKASITAFDGFKSTRSKLIRHIEDNNLELKLKKLVSKAWRQNENDLMVQRKAKYD